MYLSAYDLPQHEAPIVSLPLAGGSSATLADLNAATSALAVDDSGVYWASSSQRGKVFYLPKPLVGGATPRTLAVAQGHIRAIALDEHAVYSVTTGEDEIDDSRVVRVPKPGW